MFDASVDTVQIEVPRRLFRAMHWRPLSALVIGFTALSVSFCPLFLYWLGRDGVNITDWRVLTNFAIIFLVPGVHMSFGAPVLLRAWKRPKDSASEADDGSRRRSAKANWIFVFMTIVIGLVIWVVSGWFVK